MKISLRCRHHDLPVWQCPQFLFVFMGIMIAGIIILTFFLGTKYLIGPEFIAIGVNVLAGILLTLSFAVTRNLEKLAEINQMKTEFINIASHQLRAPLTNLKWGTNAIETNNLTKEQNENIEIIKINIDRMIKLVSDLLTVSRIEQKRFYLKKEFFFLKDIINESIVENKFYIKAKEIEIIREEENIQQIFGDSFQMRTVIDNLLNNAIKYSSSKTSVRIKLSQKNKNILFEISNQGIGIPELDQKLIFQKLFRAKNVLRTETEGTGLGLFISKSIIKQMGGEIGFKSKENQETTFWFTLPLKKQL